MFRNYFIVALRSFQRHKAFTVINVLGLALGITSALLVYLLVSDQLSYDTFHKNADRTYRITTDLYFDGEMHTPGVPSPMANAIREEAPEVEYVAEFYDRGETMLTVDMAGGKKKLQYEELVTAYANSHLFEIFDFEWKKGSPASLDEPNKIVLREKLATELFGTLDPIGQNIRVDNTFDATVAGILADGPENSDMWRSAYISLSTFPTLSEDHKERMTAWGSVNSSHQLFLTLADNGKLPQFTERVDAMTQKYHDEDMSRGPAGGDAWHHTIQPLSDVHFNDDYDGEVDKTLIWALSIVGLFLIGTACINFINLATAQALGRSKEVGIRKVVGGTRGQLFGQFMLETGSIVFISIVLAAALVNPILPAVNELTGLNISFNLLENSSLWIFLVVTFIGVTFLSGTYPALVLAGFRPALAVKGKITTQTLGGFNVRRGLVVAQFAISQLLIITVAVMTMQTNYLKNIDLGFNKDAVLVFNLPDAKPEKLQTLKNKLQGVSGVEHLSFSQTTASSGSHNWTSFKFDQREENEKSQVLTRPADANYLETYGIKLAAGRNLNPSDTLREFLVNEAFVRKMEVESADAMVGKSLEVWGREAPIVGVVKDYYQSPANWSGYEPMVIMTSSRQYQNANLKISTADVPKTLASIENVWTEMYPDDFYEYEFFDERIEGFYEMESILLTLIRTFCGVAIIIGCLGLYGLVTFLVARRLKEIGVRKVLGATVGSILGLFGKEFLRLIIIAFFIAAPLAYFAMDSFLSDYKNAIKLGGSVFVGAIFVTMLLAAITVGWHSWQAARANPAEVLKSE